jgi:protein-disulfide isomerase
MTAPTQVVAPARIPAGATKEGDGVVLGAGPVRVDAYIDFLCPFCRQFEERSGSSLARMVQDELITLVYHPLGYLDRLSTTGYSSRAASASGCASDSGAFAEYKDALFANQPPEGGPGLSDEQLVALGHVIGLTDTTFSRCVLAHAYLDWAGFVTALAVQRGVQGTPTVLVGGVPVPASAPLIAAAVADLAP